MYQQTLQLHRHSSVLSSVYIYICLFVTFTCALVSALPLSFLTSTPATTAALTFAYTFDQLATSYWCHWKCGPHSYPRLALLVHFGARLCVHFLKSDHIHPILQTLHWLPATHCIQYKISAMFQFHLWHIPLVWSPSIPHSHFFPVYSSFIPNPLPYLLTVNFGSTIFQLRSQNEIGHHAHNHKWFKQVPMLGACGI